jgi:hypothetical protein
MIRDIDGDTGGTATYEIRVRSELGDAWSDWFAGLRPSSRGDGDTVLTGPLDQAALHAVLRRIRDLGLPLISVRRVKPNPDEAITPFDSLEVQP